MISESLGRIGVSSLINLKKKEFKRTGIKAETFILTANHHTKN